MLIMFVAACPGLGYPEIQARQHRQVWDFDGMVCTAFQGLRVFLKTK